MVDVKCLSDYKLQYELDKLGFSPGPILPSTRRLYEKKLVQLLVSTPCASPVLEEPPERDRTEDCNVSGELNATISLKGNIIFSTEKSKGLKKTLQASTTKPNSLDISCLVQKHSWGVRCAARSSLPGSRGRSITPDEDYCAPTRSVDSTKLELFPVGFRLAVFGIFIIVIFVYITVERKPLFGWVL